jgi:uncharacterized protein (DUF427 family)
MAIRFSEAIPDGLRYEPTPKRVRAEAGGELALDTTRAVLVWEPGHAVPTYAVPREDLRTDVGSAGEGFEDEDLEGYVALDWEAMDRWLEEEEEVIGHPRDPFHRIDIRRSRRHVQVELDDEVLADTQRPSLLFETGLPVRFYIPREDVREELLVPTSTQTICAYKGRASYWSATIGGRVHEDIAWSYPEPLTDAIRVQGLIAFFNERVDLSVDGERLDRPQTQWSPGG